MSDTTGPRREEGRLLNVPNQITFARFGLAVLSFALLAWQQYLATVIVFVVAAATDWVDGYWARRFQQITKVGRVVDPFVDKFLICGMFIFLVAEQESGIAAWMAVVVVGRELLVTALRSFVEQGGEDFSAKMWGKVKMFLQCVAVAASLMTLIAGGASAPGWLRLTGTISAWLAVLSTIQSGVGYVRIAARSLWR